MKNKNNKINIIILDYRMDKSNQTKTKIDWIPYIHHHRRLLNYYCPGHYHLDSNISNESNQTTFEFEIERGKNLRFLSFF